ncbi:MAG: arylsulfatase [Prolixibacteraceae bacterium]|nr:arylsulfatase [Prolixibacteraceae bacterium]MBN2774004.1 arylsulfatase [Prolixibacteraceae bacterium]
MKHILNINSGLLRILIFIGIIHFLSGCNSEPKNNSVNKTPNIILIVADDLGYGDLSCYGATKIQTPAIDKLASDGMSFSNAYVSSSLCSPSRYSILTGRYSWRSRLKSGVLKYYEKPLIDEDQTTLASMLKKNGYHTACVGKWHLGFNWSLKENAPENPEKTVFDSWTDNLQEYIDFSKPVKGGPNERGFDYFYGMVGSNNMQPYVYVENDRVTEAPSEPQKPYDHYINTDKAPNWDIKTVNQTLTFKAIDVINNHFQKEADKPLFLYFPASAIHRPCLPTFTKGKSRAGLRGDIVVELDWTVKQIVNTLKENNAWENTLLIFTSDNGPRPGDPVLWLNNYKNGNYEDYNLDYFDDFSPEYVNENGNQIWKNGWLTYDHNSAGDLLGFKSDAWDGGFKVPFIVHWQGNISPGSVSTNNICLTDLMATFAELTGVQLSADEGEDSYSFVSNLFNANAPQSRQSLTLAGGSSGALVEISGGWKFIEAATPGHWPETFYPDGPSAFEPQLYNLDKDTSETNNLYEQMPEKVNELQQRIEKNKKIKKSEGI